MRTLSLILMVALIAGLAGCATFQRSEMIDTDKLQGYASGTYREDSSGPTGNWGILGSGGGGTGAGFGFGLGALGVKTGPPQSGDYSFARSIALINYSKRLKNIKYDEYGGIIDYEFEQQPLSSLKTTTREPATKTKLPSSFGHQPIE